MRHELVHIFHNKNAPHIQLDTVLLLTIPQIKWCMAGHIQQQGVFLFALDLTMHMRQCWLIIVRHMLVKFGVLLGADLGLRACPQGTGLVD